MNPRRLNGHVDTEQIIADIQAFDVQTRIGREVTQIFEPESGIIYTNRSTGMSQTVLEIDMWGRKLIYKGGGRRGEDSGEHEACTSEIGAPALIAHGDDWILQEYVPGAQMDTWRREHKRLPNGYTSGLVGTLTSCNRQKRKGFGIKFDIEQGEGFDTLFGYIRHELVRLTKEVSGLGCIDQQKVRAIEQVTESTLSVRSDRHISTLANGDLSEKDMIISDNESVRVIDYGNLCYSCIEHDLSFLYQKEVGSKKMFYSPVRDQLRSAGIEVDEGIVQLFSIIRVLVMITITHDTSDAEKWMRSLDVILNDNMIQKNPNQAWLGFLKNIW